MLFVFAHFSKLGILSFYFSIRRIKYCISSTSKISSKDVTEGELKSLWIHILVPRTGLSIELPAFII